MPDRYERMLVSIAALGDTPEANRAFELLVQHLRGHGRMRLLPRMARELRKIAARRAATAPHLEVAHRAHITEAKAEAKKQGIDVQSASVNPVLITGWRARSGDQLIDRSGKRALLDIYKNVTA